MKEKKAVLTACILFQSLYSCAQQKPMGLGLHMFKNIEQVVYCVPLPVKEFRELPAQQRGAHSFVHKKNSAAAIELAGYFITGINPGIDSLYAGATAETEEEKGRVITQSELLKNRGCFYSIGYYNNFLDKYEFIEITWVRKDEIVTMQVNYPVKEKKLWYDRLKIIIKNAYCK